MKSLLGDEKRLSIALAAAISASILYHTVDLSSLTFGWMAFQERDFSRAAQFVLGHGLSHLGPEVSGGAWLPGPFVTLLFAAPTYIFGSPRGIFLLLQLSFLLSLVVSFLLVRKHFDSTTAWLSTAFLAISPSYYMYSFAGWHASLAPLVVLLYLFVFDRAVTKKSTSGYVVAGFIVGVGLQVHLSTLLPAAIGVGFIAIYRRAQLPPLATWGLSGLGISLAYYFSMDAWRGFENTTLLLSTRFIPGPGFTFLEMFVDHYQPQVFLDQVPVTAQALLVLLGFVVSVARPKTRPFVLLVAAFALIPFVFERTEPRFYMMAHPYFEILLALGCGQLLLCLPKPGQRRVGAAGIALVLLVTYLPIDKTNANAYSIYYRDYERMETLTDILVSELKLTPEDYKNKFFFYRGENVWPFYADYPLPSWYHYHIQYRRANVSRPVDLTDRGVVVYETRHDDVIDKTHLDVVDVRTFGEFTAVLYESPYTYRMVPQYSDLLDTEIALADGTARSVVTLSGSTLSMTHVFDVSSENPRPLSFLQSLVLRETGSGLQGYSEIVSPFLRQSKFAEASPYYLRSPEIVLVFDDGAERSIELLEHHLYSNQVDILQWARLYETHGKLSETQHLGSMFVEAPVGRPIAIGGYGLADIRSVTFKSAGYATVDDSDESERTLLYEVVF